MPSKTQLRRVKDLGLIIAVFLAGTAVDVVTLSLTGFAVGGVGSIAATILAVILMYRRIAERFTIRSLFTLLRITRPRFATKWDIIIVIALFTVTIICNLPSLLSRSLPIDTGLLLYAASAAIVPPFFEELADRGFIQTAMERLHYSPWVTVTISTLIFAISHYPVNPEVVPIAIAMGTLFGLVTLRTRSVAIPFVVHGLWNLLATLGR